MSEARIPDPTLMARLQLSVKGVDWASSLVAPGQHRVLEGDWTPNQHVYHLVGNEAVFQERLTRMLAENEPQFERWNSLAHMAAHTAETDIAELAEQFMSERAKTVELLKPLSEEQWFRKATWPDGRVVDVAWVAEKALWHALDHFAGLLEMHGALEPLQAPRWRQ